ncbi:MAG: hypothetical protein IKF91_05585 [Bacilli bacterium]|nr:hypothetical protein [Bacilli bacterium]
MEKDRSTKIIAIAALLVGVVGLSLGFAAFSNTLTISSSAEVTPDQNTFNVDFSSTTSGDLTESAVTPVLTPTGVTNFTATDGTIDNTVAGAPKITGLHATFTEPGQKATYTFSAKNIGEYEAFLKSIAFENVTGESTTKVCTPGSGTTAALVTAACADINVSIKVGSEAVATGSVGSITNHSLAINANDPIVVTIEYAAGGHRADGDFTVAFGDIVLTYSSVD